MNTHSSLIANSRGGSGPAIKRKLSGFTLIELMITMVIIAIGVSLAMPTFVAVMEKRRLVSAAEEVVSFMAFARSEAIKRNKKVSVSWYTPGGHNSNWCIGASLSPKASPCDCTETNSAHVDFCSIDSVAYRLVQTDFVNMGDEFIHMRPNASSFAFDPVRGIVVRSDDEVLERESIDGDYLFYLHSDRKETGTNTRLYELQLKMYITGRMDICTDDDRQRLVGGYPIC
jgi:type IV fimbrial biogenesis protein FimT